MKNLEEGRWEKCAQCIHENVCKWKDTAFALVATVADLHQTEEMKSGHFKITVECKDFKEKEMIVKERELMDLTSGKLPDRYR